MPALAADEWVAVDTRLVECVVQSGPPAPRAGLLPRRAGGRGPGPGPATQKIAAGPGGNAGARTAGPQQQPQQQRGFSGPRNQSAPNLAELNAAHTVGGGSAETARTGLAPEHTAGAQPAPAISSLVGREATLSDLCAAFAAAAGARLADPKGALPRLVVLQGDEGNGKTSVMRAFRLWLAGEDAARAAGVLGRVPPPSRDGSQPAPASPSRVAVRVLTLRTPDPDDMSGRKDARWLGWRTAWFEHKARALLPSLSATPGLAPSQLVYCRLLAKIIPSLITGPAVEGEAPADELADWGAAVRTDAILHLALHVLAAVASAHPTPLVVLVDDAHLMDDRSLALLAEWMGLQAGPMLVVTAVRPVAGTGAAVPAAGTDFSRCGPAVAGLLRRLRRDLPALTVTLLPLAPLAGPALEAHVCTMYGARALDPRLAALFAAVLHMHEGNLLYVRELALALVAGDFLEVDDGRVVLLTKDPGELVQLPREADHLDGSGPGPGAAAATAPPNSPAPAPAADAADEGDSPTAAPASFLVRGTFPRLVIARLAALSPAARAAAHAAAALGSPVIHDTGLTPPPSLGLLARIVTCLLAGGPHAAPGPAGFSVADAADWDRELTSAGIWDAAIGFSGGRVAQFAHSRYSRAVYVALVREERAACRAARGLAAARAFGSAGLGSSLSRLNPDAPAHYLPVLPEYDREASAPSNAAAAATGAADASLGELGLVGSLTATSAEAAAGGPASEAPACMQQALCQVGVSLLGEADVRGAEHVLRRAKVVAEDAGDEPARTQASTSLTLLYFLSGRLQEALGEADALIAWADAPRRRQDRESQRSLQVGRLDRLRILLAQGDGARAAPLEGWLLSELLPQARSAGDRRSALNLQSLALWCKIASGRHTAAAADVATLLPEVLAADTPRGLFSTFSLLGPLHGALRLAEMGVASAGGRVLETGIGAHGTRRLQDNMAQAVSKMAVVAQRFQILVPRAALLEGVLHRLKGDPAAARKQLMAAVVAAANAHMLFEMASGFWELRRFAPGGREALRRALALYRGQNATWAVARCLAAQADPSAFDVDMYVV